MSQRFSRRWEQLVLEDGLRPVSKSFILALGNLQSFLLPDYLLRHLEYSPRKIREVSCNQVSKALNAIIIHRRVTFIL